MLNQFNLHLPRHSKHKKVYLITGPTYRHKYYSTQQSFLNSCIRNFYRFLFKKKKSISIIVGSISNHFKNERKQSQGSTASRACLIHQNIAELYALYF